MADRNYGFLFNHHGMLQADRQALAPSADAMQVSGRRFEDLLKRTAEFAERVIFTGDDNSDYGSWAPFFSVVYDSESHRVRTEVIDEMVRTSSVPPHLALLFAFYKMLLVEQEDLNKLTGRQMDYYFREILGFKLKQAVEGTVTVFAELAKNTLSVGIPKGQLFDAGKDTVGNPITYESIDELRLGREEVARFARYKDNIGFEAVDAEGSHTMHALCIASRLFGVTGRMLRVTFGKYEDIHRRLAKLEAEYTSAEGWASAGHYDVRTGLSIGDDMVPMAPYDPSIHGEGLETAFPVIRFVSADGLGNISTILPNLIRDISVTLEDGVPLRLENRYGSVENLSGVNPFGFEGHFGDGFSVILPFPSASFELSVELNVNENEVYRKVPSRKKGTVETDRESYEIITNACDQEWVSMEFSKKILSVMKKEGLKEEEIQKAMEGKIMAVSPRLTAPVSIKSAVFTDDVPDIFLAHPCGALKVRGNARVNSALLINTDDFRTDGDASPSAVFLALTDVDLDSGQLSLHFRMEDNVHEAADRVVWYYLSGDEWRRFSESSVIRDTTCGFSQDGTIVLDYQKRMQRGGGGFQDKFTWIKASCSNGNCLSVVEVRSRAIELAYSKSSKGAGPAGAALPAGSISKMVGSVVGLKKVSQPYDGLTGTRAEEASLFFRRVAEMLRHKGRAWSAWDYESLVLEAFPEVAYAKCLPSYSFRDEDVKPGSVTMVVIPFVFRDELQPESGVRLINKVREKLKTVCSPFIGIEVANPVYREVSVDVIISLRQGYNDAIRYEALVNDALMDFLQSWKGTGEGVHFREGNGVSDIIAFLETLPYVDYIEDIHVFLGGRDGEVDMDGSIELDSPLEVITSASGHEVHCHTAN